MVAMDERLTPELVFIVCAGVERQVVERRLYVMLLEERHQSRAELQSGAHEVIHVSVIRGVGRDLRQLDTFLLDLPAQDTVVDLPDTETFPLYVVQLLELCP